MVYEPVEEGFEHELATWQLTFEREWGYFWWLFGGDVSGETVVAAGQSPGYLTPNTTFVVGVGGGDDPLFVVIYNWPGAECVTQCDPCDSYGPIGYRAIEGEIELSVWDDYADFRLTNLVFQPEFDGEVMRVPLIEVTGLPYLVCPHEDIFCLAPRP